VLAAVEKKWYARPDQEASCLAGATATDDLEAILLTIMMLK